MEADDRRGGIWAKTIRIGLDLPRPHCMQPVLALVWICPMGDDSGCACSLIGTIRPARGFR